jgi:hypothetical protein
VCSMKSASANSTDLYLLDCQDEFFYLRAMIRMPGGRNVVAGGVVSVGSVKDSSRSRYTVSLRGGGIYHRVMIAEFDRCALRLLAGFRTQRTGTKRLSNLT